MEARIGKRITVRPDGCWIMDGNPDKYAKVGSTHKGTTEQAHCYVYRTLKGPIPRGYHLHHKCFNKGCVNPAHLQPLTPAEHGAIHSELDPLHFRGKGAPWTRSPTR
jgi:hypothetical protein